MELAPEDTSTDWERLRAAFEHLRKEYGVLALDEPQPDESWDEVVDKISDEMEKTGKSGNVCFTEESQAAARESGMLGVSSGVNRRQTVGHRLVAWLFNTNVSFALRDAEKRAFVSRVVRTLRLHGLNAEWPGDTNKAIRVHGKWD
ncbi:MAG: hypothetical protein QOC81_96 [Thermoanaerobaculia bacterium]|jgi:hypothetical protein|nr:hypothetical protein [Thermoanaerobaculia bacterium]